MTAEIKCLYCGETGHNVPLVHIYYQEKPLWICSQHLPMLIHKLDEIKEQLDQAASNA